MEWMSGPGSKWHLARRKEHRGVRTGKVLYKFVVTACNGKQLGGPWGSKVMTEPGECICKKCELIAARENLVAAALNPCQDSPKVNGHSP
jgi:hypothetical protein